MSRIGKIPVKIPSNVTVTQKDNELTVKGPKGELKKQFHAGIRISVDKGLIHVARPDESRQSRNLHGLTRTLVNNMVVGVTTGFVRELHLIGVGYKVAKQGQGIQINCGYSHPVEIKPIPGIEFDVEVERSMNRIKVRGIDRELVGQVAANIRFIRPPEPYKGKGIKYAEEVIIRKMGKAGKAAK